MVPGGAWKVGGTRCNPEAQRAQSKAQSKTKRQGKGFLCVVLCDLCVSALKEAYWRFSLLWRRPYAK